MLDDQNAPGKATLTDGTRVTLTSQDSTCVSIEYRVNLDVFGTSEIFEVRLVAAADLA